MPYTDIYKEVAGLTGLTQDSQKSFVKNLVNKAAEDLYSQTDLVNCLREQVFVKDQGSTTPEIVQYTLPWYVWKLRGMREYNTGIEILNHDMRPRYQTQGWREFIDPMMYRVKANQLLSSNIVNEGPLTINLPDGESVDTAFDINISGSSASKTRFTEKLSFAVGDTTKNTVNLFSSLDGFRKSVTTTFDLYIKDANSNLVSFVPNCELQPNFTLIQISDYSAWNPVYIEVLYKTRFIPFDNDFDEFPCGPLYDKAIVYKAAEHYYITYRKQFDLAASFYTKVCEVVKNIAADFSENQEMLMDFGSNRYLNMVPSQISRTPLNPFYRLYRGV